MVNSGANLGRRDGWAAHRDGWANWRDPIASGELRSLGDESRDILNSEISCTECSRMVRDQYLHRLASIDCARTSITRSKLGSDTRFRFSECTRFVAKRPQFATCDRIAPVGPAITMSGPTVTTAEIAPLLTIAKEAGFGIEILDGKTPSYLVQRVEKD